jgi:hypothetical protein
MRAYLSRAPAMLRPCLAGEPSVVPIIAGRRGTTFIISDLQLQLITSVNCPACHEFEIAGPTSMNPFLHLTRLL